MKNQIYYVEDIEPLVDQYHGNVAAIARHLGASRNTIYNRIRESAGLQRAINDARQTMVDEAESSLYTAVLDGNMTAIIFFLKTQGKDRGYVEKQEHRIENLNIDMSALTDDQLRRIADGEDPIHVISASG